MKFNFALIILLIGSIFVQSGCSNNDDLKQDATKIGDAMCRSLHVMNQLKAADPDDVVLVKKLRQNASSLQEEMAILYKDFNKKWGDKTKKEAFQNQFRKELRRAMLECKSLSKEDRETFTKELEE